MKSNNFSKSFRLYGLCAGLLISGAANAIYLPPPEALGAGVIPLAVQYDDGYSYSTRVLDYFYPTMDYSGTGTGTGNLDILITTRSSGASNPAGFAAPVVNPNDDPVTGSWSVSVKTLADYLFSTFQSYIPVFTFDQAEPGGNKGDLLVSAQVEIRDASGALVKRWAFDDFKNDAYDVNRPALAPGEICIPDVLNPAYLTNPSLKLKCFDNNSGSGQFDFLVLVQDMDLSNYDEVGYSFNMNWKFSDIGGGGEEITLTGLQTTNVPEPGVLALVGIGLLGFSLARRRNV